MRNPQQPPHTSIIVITQSMLCATTNVQRIQPPTRAQRQAIASMEGTVSFLYHEMLFLGVLWGNAEHTRPNTAPGYVALNFRVNCDACGPISACLPTYEHAVVSARLHAAEAHMSDFTQRMEIEYSVVPIVHLDWDLYDFTCRQQFAFEKEMARAKRQHRAQVARAAMEATGVNGEIRLDCAPDTTEDTDHDKAAQA